MKLINLKIDTMTKNSKRGRKPSFLRKSLDSRLALVTNNSYFLVRATPGVDSDYLQRLVSSYVCLFQTKYNYSRLFRTQRVSNGIRVYRVR